jgi:hypothetical protein
MKRITNLLDDHPFAVLITYYTMIAIFGFAFLTPVCAQTPTVSYVKEWKCPYCHHHWKYGERCQNESCPTMHWNGNDH